MSDSDLSPARIAEIRARCEAATPGPWDFATKTGHYVWFNEEGTEQAQIDGCVMLANSRFIAHARTDLPDCLDEIERLQGEVDWLAEKERAQEIHEAHMNVEADDAKTD